MRSGIIFCRLYIHDLCIFMPYAVMFRCVSAGPKGSSCISADLGGPSSWSCTFFPKNSIAMVLLLYCYDCFFFRFSTKCSKLDWYILIWWIAGHFCGMHMCRICVLACAVFFWWVARSHVGQMLPNPKLLHVASWEDDCLYCIHLYTVYVIAWLWM